MKRKFADKNNVLLVNITRLGDMLQATPTIAGIKQENPECKITVLLEKQFEEVCNSIPGVDEVISLDLGMTVRSLAREGEGIVDAFEYLTEVVEDLRHRKYDFCLNMSSSAYTALLLKLVGIERNGGWTSDEEGYRVIESQWARLFASSVFHQNREFNSLNLVDIFRCSADVEKHPHSLVLNVKSEAQLYADSMLAEAQFTNDGPLIAVQAGASQGKRQWSTARFVEMIRVLDRKYRARVLLIGSKKELSIIEPIKAGCDSANVFVAAGRTNIPQLAALLKACKILITGDTGPMHLSVSVGTPVIAMFLASAYGFETGPYSEGNLVLQPVIACGPCNPNKPCARPDCHDQIEPTTLAELTMMRIQRDFTSLPEGMFDPSKVTVYRSFFDQWGFCDLKPLNSDSHDEYRAYRAAYRKLWLDDLGGFPQPTEGLNNPRKGLAILDDSIQGLAEVVQLAEKGQQLIEDLSRLIRDISAPGKALGAVSKELNDLDRKIESLGFDRAPLGPLTRMFIFGKENISGSDPSELASQMGGVYRDLARRGVKLGQFYRAGGIG